MSTCTKHNEEYLRHLEGITQSMCLLEKKWSVGSINYQEE